MSKKGSVEQEARKLYCPEKNANCTDILLQLPWCATQSNCSNRENASPNGIKMVVGPCRNRNSQPNSVRSTKNYGTCSQRLWREIL
mmetsp:Transcript_3330/g.7779  ORF Transcript_3330/g.7779 Transcript_3330/m.7779 type:complete len:86 (-) Transcript_3330:103-360(-)